MTSAEEFAALYGPPAKHSEYKPGDTVRYTDHSTPSRENRGQVLYVVAATKKSPLIYVITPEVEQFPVEVEAGAIIVGG